MVEKLIYIVAVAEPLANLPQIYTIFAHHDATGVSITSWILYASFALTWLWYGIHLKLHPTIIGGSLFFVTDLCVVAGAIMFGGRLF